MTNYNKDAPDERFGFIYLPDDTDLMPRNAIRFTSVQGDLEDAGIFKQVQEILLLPEQYTVIGLYRQPLRRNWHVIVKSRDIPVQEEKNTDLPCVVPNYHRKDGKPMLTFFNFNTNHYSSEVSTSLYLLCMAKEHV